MAVLDFLSSEHEDMLFEEKNKAYGAYYARKRYNRNLRNSMLIAIGLVVFAFGFPLVLSWLADQMPVEKEEVKIIEISQLSEPPPIDKTAPPPPPPPPVELPKATIKFLPPVVKPDEEVPDEKLATVEELKETEAGVATVEGTKDAVAPIVEGIDEGAEPAPFLIVEQMPEFPGGEKALFEYLGKNIKYPPMAKEAHIEGKVYLSFVVKSDGSISDVKVLRGIKGGCNEEAVRVVSSMPSWKPGKQAGKSVPVQYNLPINFTLR